MGAYRELTAAGITTREAADLTGVARSTATRTVAKRSQEPAVGLIEGLLEEVAALAGRPGRVAAAGPVRPAPANQLTKREVMAVLAVLNGPEFIDRTPLQVYAALLGRGEYLCSVSTMYRILGANKQVKERRRLARHETRARPELIATGPGQVFTWDITKLPGPDKGVYYDAYVMIDIYSRYIVGACVHVTETALLAEEMMLEVFAIHGTPQVVHADRGTSMTSKTVAALLTDLNVTRSHSRPKVSNDNPYSEAWFKTVKYAPMFPDRFGSLQHARVFLDEFVQHYNHEHHHTGIGLNTPADVHYGLTAAITQRRQEALATARAANPERFTTTRTPKILRLPAAAWINPPVVDPTMAPTEPQPAIA